MKKKLKKEKTVIPKNIIDSIPYVAAYESGIIQVRPGMFSQSYPIPPINFDTTTGENQNHIADEYMQFLNSFEPGVDIQITMYNRTIDMDALRDTIFLPMREDSLNSYREEYNHMLTDQVSKVNRNLKTDVILTVTVSAIDIVEAEDKLAHLRTSIESGILSMTKMGVEPFTLEQRLDLLHKIYCPGVPSHLGEKRIIEGKEVTKLSLESLALQGISSKELIAPDSLEFLPGSGKVGDHVFKSFFISAYPSYIRSTMMTDFAQIPTNLLISVFFSPLNQAEAIRQVKEQSVNAKSEIIKAQKQAAKNGILGDLAVPVRLANTMDEADEIYKCLTQEDGRMFYVTFLITLFAKDKEELAGYESHLKAIANKSLLTLKSLDFQQEDGLASSLPIGNNKVLLRRRMLSYSLRCIIPFSVKDIEMENGMYYGLNAESGNLILYNRVNPKTSSNGCILGMPGAGKSFAAKREMVNVLLNTDDEIYVIDPEREYLSLAQSMNGSIVKLAVGSDARLNPFDLNLDNIEDGVDPVKLKADFIITLCDLMIGGRYGLDDIEKTAIERSVKKIYEPYILYLYQNHLRWDTEHAPTLKDLYDDLMRQPSQDAVNLALSMERYVQGGSMDAFSYRTNIDTNNRFLVYDINGIGSGLKEMGLFVALDNIWNRMIENKKKDKTTWIYIDEFYLMMQKESSADYISTIWKRARKWGGVPTAITQNVNDLVSSKYGRDIIDTSPFTILLGQSPGNKKQLAGLLNISPEEQKYIASAKPGRGLLQIDNDFIPFDDTFPKQTELYRIMSTKPKEDL